MKKNDDSKVFRKFIPIKEVSVPCEGGGVTIGLGKSEDDHRFYILIWRGDVEVSSGYRSREVAQVLYNEKVHEFTKEILDQLDVTMRAAVDGKIDLLEGGKAAALAIRLKNADDEETHADREWNREYRRVHGDEAFLDLVKEQLMSQKRQREAEEE
jgi:hypothetical protein